MTDEKKILRLLQNRSESAIQELNRRYGDLCTRIAMGIVDNSEDAEECVSDTMLMVWNRIPPEQPDSLAAYIS